MAEKAPPGAAALRRWLRQLLVVVLINVPAMSSGLAMGWVSFASGEAGEGEDDARLVAGAVVTCVASLGGVALSARALAAGRRLALIATSAMFMVCWALKLCGGWWVVGARAAAGLAAAGAWFLAPLLAREMCEARVRGAAAAALAAAHNLGLLLMYLAADLRLPHRWVVCGCLALSALHCAASLLLPESPAYLAARARLQEARAALAWLRGGGERELPELARELAALPAPHAARRAPLRLVRELWSDARRRRALLLVGVVLVAQEACGVQALLHFAERAFALAAPPASPAPAALGSPARQALLLGVAQLLGSLLALYLVEAVGRKPLVVWSATGAGALLCCAGGAAALRSAAAAPALLAAVLCDAAGLQAAPYAMLTDMFHYEYRSCAVALLSAAAWAANALELCAFPLLAARAGLAAALLLAGGATLALAAFAAAALPETRARDPDDIYRELGPPPPPPAPATTFHTHL